MPEVAQERTGWRDERMSLRHRNWGFDCPAVDIDFLMLEYNHGKAVALVEYKHERAQAIDTAHPSYHAMRDLAERAGIPAFVVRYTDDFKTWTVQGLDELGTAFFLEPTPMTELEWIGFLYWLRGCRLSEMEQRFIVWRNGVMDSPK